MKIHFLCFAFCAINNFRQESSTNKILLKESTSTYQTKKSGGHRPIKQGPIFVYVHLTLFVLSYIKLTFMIFSTCSFYYMKKCWYIFHNFHFTCSATITSNWNGKKHLMAIPTYVLFQFSKPQTEISSRFYLFENLFEYRKYIN